MKKKNKDVEVKSRVTRTMREDVEKIAADRGETMSLVVREAIGEYLAKRKPVKSTRVLRVRSTDRPQ